eukprot:CAMPEP_0196765390 /NCGR_PEP_ID=MMETSP1095-20130614/8532_1 /TAXON_ID=96789 ORGANISM="Chromulina nebulosa, Strain UTEXLB2642" /NCGR_SAMPLE_ID=MMETSP1095 /ASSEMBLY_ACC=CAM_ASM_000446 /LENGTH=133 /DNA_ID=CAMNT_0042123349 /DNA_START=191 /DNA_END=592 /DNA_ORIENTATION=+
MSIWNGQKIGQQVIDTTTIPPSDVDSSHTDGGIAKTFKRSVGAGSDERPLYGTSFKEEEEANHATISKIDKYLRQKSLLTGLTSMSMSEHEKLERIKLAAAYENLLPTEFSEGTIVAPSFNAAGLLNDWDFEF